MATICHLLSLKQVLVAILKYDPEVYFIFSNKYKSLALKWNSIENTINLHFINFKDGKIKKLRLWMSIVVAEVELGFHNLKFYFVFSSLVCSGIAIHTTDIL